MTQNWFSGTDLKMPRFVRDNGTKSNKNGTQGLKPASKSFWCGCGRDFLERTRILSEIQFTTHFIETVVAEMK